MRKLDKVVLQLLESFHNSTIEDEKVIWVGENYKNSIGSIYPHSPNFDPIKFGVLGS